MAYTICCEDILDEILVVDSGGAPPSFFAHCKMCVKSGRVPGEIDEKTPFPALLVSVRTGYPPLNSTCVYVTESRLTACQMSTCSHKYW